MACRVPENFKHTSTGRKKIDGSQRDTTAAAASGAQLIYLFPQTNQITSVTSSQFSDTIFSCFNKGTPQYFDLRTYEPYSCRSNYSTVQSHYKHKENKVPTFRTYHVEFQKGVSSAPAVQRPSSQPVLCLE